MEPLKVGILGSGAISRARAAQIQKLPECKIVAVCSTKESAASDFAKEYDAKAFTDWRAFLRDADLEAVVISTPNYLHFPMALESIRLKKHTLIEYPMALSLEEYDALVGEAVNHHVVLHHALNCQLEDYYLTVKSVLPEIGKVFCSKDRWFGPRTAWYENDEKRGSLFVAFHVHFVDHFRGLFGEPLWVEAVDQSSLDDGIPMGVMFMEFANKVTGYIEFGHGFDPCPQWSWSILGSKGHIEYDGADVRLYTRDGQRTVSLLDSDKWGVDTKDFVDQILTGTAPLRTLDDTRKSIEISIAADLAAQENGRTILI